MITTKKLLASLITALVFSVCSGATAYASEITNVDSTKLNVVSSTGDIANIGTISVTGSAINIQISNSAQDSLGSIESTDNIMDLLLQDGYYLDEQGQLCYEEPTEEEPTVEEEEVTEDTQASASTEKKPSYAEKDLRLLACLIFSEAGNQNYNGMLGVANVVLNRVNSDVYWNVNTIEEVIYDNKWSVQFAVTIKNSKTGLSMIDRALKYYDTRKFTGSNPEAEKKAMNRAIKAAKAALEGKNNIGDYLCFQNKRCSGSIKKKYSDYKIIDDHIFYRTK